MIPHMKPKVFSMERKQKKIFFEKERKKIKMAEKKLICSWEQPWVSYDL